MKRSLSRGEKYLVLLCGALILGVGGLGAMRARLDDEPNWSIPEPTPTPYPNGYDLYVAAKAAIIPAKPPVDRVNDPKLLTDPKQIASQYSLARRTAWLKQNAAAWKLFEQAKAADCRQAVGRGQFTMPMGSYAGLRELARCKIIAVNTAKMRGDWNDAAKNGLDVTEMGSDVARGGPMMGFLVGVAIEAIGEDSFRNTPAHLSAKEARFATQRLEKLLGTRPSLADAMREDKWEGLCQLRYLLQQPSWRRLSSWGLKGSLKDKLGAQLLSKRQVVESYIRSADWVITVAQQPYSPTPPAAPEPGNLINQTLNPNFARAKFNEARADTQLSLLLLRLALRAYRLERGAYPTTLSPLTPDYLTRIPLDPFGNKTPLHYRKKGDSYLLWSIGPDGKDDKGKPSPPRGTRKIAMISPDNVGDAIAVPEWK